MDGGPAGRCVELGHCEVVTTRGDLAFSSGVDDGGRRHPQLAEAGMGRHRLAAIASRSSSRVVRGGAAGETSGRFL